MKKRKIISFEDEDDYRERQVPGYASYIERHEEFKDKHGFYEEQFEEFLDSDDERDTFTIRDRNRIRRFRF